MYAPGIIDRWRHVCSDVVVDGPISITFEISEQDRNDDISAPLYVRTMIVVDDVNHPGADVSLSFMRAVPREIRGELEMVQFLRSIAHWFFVHECDERIAVRGERKFLPHGDHGDVQ